MSALQTYLLGLVFGFELGFSLAATLVQLGWWHP